MEEKKEKTKDIELRSEKVRNIIGQIPPFLVRSGIGVIALVILLGLGVCYFIPYYETVEGRIEIVSIPESKIFTSPVDGTVYISPKFESDGAIVERGEGVGCVRTVDTVFSLVAGISRRLLLNVRQGENVTLGEVLFAIAPDSVLSVRGHLMLPYAYKEKIAEGQQVKINLSGFPSKEYGILLGVIGMVYPLVVETGKDSEHPIDADSDMLKVEVDLPEGLRTSIGKELPFSPDMHGSANVVISKQSLLLKLFTR